MAIISYLNKITGICIFFWITSNINGFRVVIDPGHGGRYMEPESVYGDKYDPDAAGFLEGYRPGASVSGLDENEDVFAIALLVKEFLDLTNTVEGRKKFHKILKKYDPNVRIPDQAIEVFISRKPGYRARYWEIDYDVNRDYRLYDHHDLITNTPVEGVISRINQLHPELVVSLHLTGGNPDKLGGLSSVITPAYNTYQYAIDYVTSSKENRKIVQQTFLKGAYGSWFTNKYERTPFEWFLCDSWIYFTGYWSQIDGLDPDGTKFRGFRQNMITWNYSDEEKSVGNPETPGHLKYFKPTGKFWEREKSDPELWRRDAGPEGYGGDNLYASQELLRFIRKGLLVNSVKTPWSLPKIIAPYISTWSVPTYVNAIAAFIELAYLNNPHDFARIERNKKVHAEAIAVGIYSIFYGTKSQESARKKDLPWGTPVNFKKYMDYSKGNYFNLVRD